MPERGFDTGFWDDPVVQKLPPLAKLLHAYMWTNNHCSASGLYVITLETISFETGIPTDELPDLLNLLKEKVKWYPEENLIWVKNFVKRQTKSPDFLKAVAKYLKQIHYDQAVQELLKYNRDRYGIEIPYSLPQDIVALETIPPDEKLASFATYYEEKIGIRTSLNAEWVIEMSNVYSLEEFKAAIDEAVKQGKRTPQYIESILEGRKVREGPNVRRRAETHKGHTPQDLEDSLNRPLRP